MRGIQRSYEYEGYYVEKQAIEDFNDLDVEVQANVKYNKKKSIKKDRDMER
ncbi:hypothetical protein [Pseudogracilibacillus sp. SO30301A]|uniref:hypothetical protein n=1 Tax=Pseudogracilibacillus sp. SO30301A TaxID=3098291 RepID=UPI00300E5BBB